MAGDPRWRRKPNPSPSKNTRPKRSEAVRKGNAMSAQCGPVAEAVRRLRQVRHEKRATLSLSLSLNCWKKGPVSSWNPTIAPMSRRWLRKRGPDSKAGTQRAA